MKALIIGAAGFVGGYLINHLSSDCGFEVCATKLCGEKIENENISVYDLDIMNKEDIILLLQKEKPQQIYHLAAQSSVSVSWDKPQLTADINIKGTINLLEAVRESGYSPKILLVGSGEEYGYVLNGEVPITEDTLMRPGNIYAVTKACQGMLGEVYARAYNMDIVMVRAFNHIGPLQSDTFVIADFCKQVAFIEAGKKPPVISVGNLDAKRDFTDVRDIVRAYSLLMQSGKKGETYNVGSGKAVSIRNMLDKILSHSKVKINIETDPKRLRPSDVPIIEADISKLCAHTGWKRNISIDDTIEDILEYWRNIAK